MAFVVIRCPATGRQLYTGIETDPDLLDLYHDGQAATACPHCHQPHSWTRSDAVFLDPDSPSEDSEVRSCLVQAREALKRAATAESPGERASCMGMAQRWIALADRWRDVGEAGEQLQRGGETPLGSQTVL